MLYKLILHRLDGLHILIYITSHISWLLYRDWNDIIYTHKKCITQNEEDEASW